jgi:hypothetical protein
MGLRRGVAGKLLRGAPENNARGCLVASNSGGDGLDGRRSTDDEEVADTVTKGEWSACERATTASIGVSGVLACRTVIQVARVTAGRIVAGVTSQVLRWATAAQFKRDPMRAGRATLEADLTVACCIASAGPGPAGIGSARAVNLRPEALCEWGRMTRHRNLLCGVALRAGLTAPEHCVYSV